MSHPSRTVRSLAAGAALAACSLASAEVWSTLQFSTLDLAHGSVSLGQTSGSFSFAGPPTNVHLAPLSIDVGTGQGDMYAASFPYFGGMDLFWAGLDTNYAYYTNGSSYMFFQVTISQAVIFYDVADIAFAPGEVRTSVWTVDGVGPVSSGSILSAGQYTFRGNLTWSGPNPSVWLAYGFGLASASVSVPLPGAAGLAAIGLAGMSRRRRR